jgi:hypothetical protein
MMEEREMPSFIYPYRAAGTSEASLRKIRAENPDKILSCGLGQSPRKMGRLADFLDAFFRHINELSALEPEYVQVVKKAHVFYLGDGEDCFDNASEICKMDRLPLILPFDNMLLVTHECDMQLWRATHLNEYSEVSSKFLINRRWEQSGPMSFCTFHEVWNIGMNNPSMEYTEDVNPINIRTSLTPSSLWGCQSAMEKLLASEFSTSEVITPLMVTSAISHPHNYVVRVEPKMTDGERRAEAKGKNWDRDRRRPHYIVIDHSDVTRLNPANRGGTHASPRPHPRRGHWMTLRSERYRILHAQGVTKVPVRATIVGKDRFEDDKNHYHVIMKTPGEDSACASA